jgi:hypothetical protein
MPRQRIPTKRILRCPEVPGQIVQANGWPGHDRPDGWPPPEGGLCFSEQRAVSIRCTLIHMSLQSIKVTLGAGWALATLLIGIAVEATSPGTLAALAAFGILPPLAMLLLWNDPPQTMSESIREGRR